MGIPTLGMFVFLDPRLWNYGIPTFSVNRTNFEGTYQIVYSVRFLFAGFTITLDNTIDNGNS